MEVGGQRHQDTQASLDVLQCCEACSRLTVYGILKERLLWQALVTMELECDAGNLKSCAWCCGVDKTSVRQSCNLTVQQFSAAE